MKKYLIKIIPILVIISMSILLFNGIITLLLYEDGLYDIVNYLEEVEIISGIIFIASVISWFIVIL